MVDRLSALFLLLGAGLLLVNSARAQSSDPHATAKRGAHSAAQDWLGLLEDRDFEESWEEAAASFRERIGRSEWRQTSTRMADSIGTPEARTRTSTQYRDSLRHAETEGPFVVLKYRTRFSSGVYEELLLVSREEDRWTVAGYRMRPLRTPDPPLPPLP